MGSTGSLHQGYLKKGTKVRECMHLYSRQREQPLRDVYNRSRTAEFASEWLKWTEPGKRIKDDSKSSQVTHKTFGIFSK